MLCVSALGGDGVEAVYAYLGAGKTAAFIGSSGVGKSTLINRLLKKEALATAGLRKDESRASQRRKRKTYDYAA